MSHRARELAKTCVREYELRKFVEAVEEVVHA